MRVYFFCKYWVYTVGKKGILSRLPWQTILGQMLFSGPDHQRSQQKQEKGFFISYFSSKRSQPDPQHRYMSFFPKAEWKNTEIIQGNKWKKQQQKVCRATSEKKQKVYRATSDPPPEIIQGENYIGWILYRVKNRNYTERKNRNYTGQPSFLVS